MQKVEEDEAPCHSRVAENMKIIDASYVAYRNELPTYIESSHS